MKYYKIRALGATEFWITARSEDEALYEAEDAARIEIALGAYSVDDIEILEVTGDADE